MGFGFSSNLPVCVFSLGTVSSFTFECRIDTCRFDHVFMMLAGYFLEFLCGCFIVSLVYVFQGVFVVVGDGLTLSYLVPPLQELL